MKYLAKYNFSCFLSDNKKLDTYNISAPKSLVFWFHNFLNYQKHFTKTWKTWRLFFPPLPILSLASQHVRCSAWSSGIGLLLWQWPRYRAKGALPHWCFVVIFDENNSKIKLQITGHRLKWKTLRDKHHWHLLLIDVFCTHSLHFPSL